MNCVSRSSGPALVLMGLFVLLCSSPCFAGPKQLAPRPGILLVADKTIADPRFHQAVILLLSHDMQHSAGLIINKPTDIKAGMLGLDLPALSQLPIYYGGPVAP
nr:YqgE/AlgH family protein [Desulfuromonadales bacterium]